MRNKWVACKAQHHEFYKQNIFMGRFKIIPLSKEYAAKIRSTKKDVYGNAVAEQVATGKGPCRVSLKPFVRGVDKRLLLSHNPFEIKNAFNQPGPVFIHAEEVEEYSDVHHFPPEIKADKKSFPLTLVGYSNQQQMNFTKLVGDADVDELIEKVFDEHAEVAYLHARNAEACCYICRIERA